MSEKPGNAEPKEKIHKIWMGALLLGGVLLAGIAFALDRLFPNMGSSDLSIWQSIATNLGVGLFSAGLVLIIEPKVRRSIKEAVKQASVDVKSQVRAEVKRDVEIQFDSIKQEIRTTLQSEKDAQDTLLSDFRSTYSQPSARAAMELVSVRGGLQDSKISVPGSQEPGELVVFLSLQYVGDEPGYGEPLYAVIGDYSLCLGARTESGEAFVIWNPSEKFADAIKELSVELESAGVLGSAKVQDYDWDAIAGRLADSLQIALDSRRKTPGKIHLAGPLSEVVGINNPWYITSESLECPAHGYIAHASDFPKRDVYTNGNADFPDALPRPDFADPWEWEYVLNEAANRFSPVALGPF